MSSFACQTPVNRTRISRIFLQTSYEFHVMMLVRKNFCLWTNKKSIFGTRYEVFINVIRAQTSRIFLAALKYWMIFHLYWCRLERIGIKMGTPVAQWIRLLLPSCRPGFESQALHLRLYQFKLWHVEKTKLTEKEADNAPPKIRIGI